MLFILYPNKITRMCTVTEICCVHTKSMLYTGVDDLLFVSGQNHGYPCFLTMTVGLPSLLDAEQRYAC